MKSINTKIYIADVSCLEDKALFDEKSKSVKQERQKKLEKIRFDGDKRLSLGVELLLKKALADAGMDYDKTEIIYGENGKPYIKGNGLFYSLSHSGTLAVCAVSDSEIGVDAEQISRADFKIAKRIFTDREIAFIDGSAEKFIRLWTLKESYMKYCGSGLSVAPRDIEIVFNDNRPDFRNLEFFETEIPGYKIALCGSSEAELIVASDK